MNSPHESSRCRRNGRLRSGRRSKQALAKNTVLRLTYTDAAGQESNRIVEPAGLLTADGRWYLIGWCRTRQAGRGFRLDRSHQQWKRVNKPRLTT